MNWDLLIGPLPPKVQPNLVDSQQLSGGCMGLRGELEALMVEHDGKGVECLDSIHSLEVHFETRT